MSNWQNYFLDDLAYYYNGKAFKPSDWKSDGVKIIRIEQINNPNGDYDYYQGVFPDNNSIDNGDLIFSWSATLKVVIWKHGKGVLNQHLFKVIPKHFVNKDYLYFLLDYNMLKLGDTSHGSTMKHIKRGELKKYNVAVPEYPIQQKIAKILSTIDGQIEKTEAIIAKYQAVKQGMLQDLFTRGIDVTTGELRPKYEDAPELYKDSPLGMIPKEWEVSILDDCHTQERYSYTGGPFGSSLKSEDYTTEGIRIIQLQNIGDGMFRDDYKIYTSTKKADELSSCNIYPGEIIIAKMADPLARACIMPNTEQRFLMASDGIRLKVDSERFDVKFILETINSHYFRSQALSCSTGTTRARIGLTELRNLEFKHPALMEQKIISQKLSSVENEILLSEKEHNKLQLLKQGLMSDLLSGKVEVTA